VCGIAGILTDPDCGPTSLEELRRMVAMLCHRGPDGYGLYRDSHVGLAHSRLSIIDLMGGAQPMCNEDGSIWVTFNGEIFNHVELRRQLEDTGHRFSTQSDTEVIVHCFEEYGPGAWEVFNGQFALALWDARAHELWLVRDRVGILPLYYARADGRIVFGSEAKAIFASGHLAPQFDGRGLTEVFMRWAAPAPATVFRKVRSLPPGTAMRFDEQLRERQTHYWQPDFSEHSELSDLSLDDAAEALGERLARAVRLRLRADVPVGAYLSGGLDSSVIGRLIRQVDSSPLQTFAVRFADPEFDETDHQRRMAELLRTHHEEIVCSADEIGKALPEVVWHCETPLLRTAPAPLFYLSELVNRRGMKVVLTGEGADELIAGYDIFKEDKIRRFWARQPESSVRPALLSKLYSYVADAQVRSGSLWRKSFSRGLTDVEDPFYSHRIRWSNAAWSLRFLAPDLRGGADPEEMNAGMVGAMPPNWRSWQPLARSQMIEIHTFMSPYLLSCQGDRVAMGHSVEVRYPFLDPHVVDFCAQLPRRLKLRGLQDKVVLRRLASGILPREISQRPKQPYRAPMGSVVFGQRVPDYVDDLLSESSLAKFGLIEQRSASKLIQKARRRAGRMTGEREQMALIGLVTLQLLARLFQVDFDARARRARKKLDYMRLTVLEDRLDGRPTKT